MIMWAEDHCRASGPEKPQGPTHVADRFNFFPWNRHNVSKYKRAGQVINPIRFHQFPRTLATKRSHWTKGSTAGCADNRAAVLSLSSLTLKAPGQSPNNLSLPKKTKEPLGSPLTHSISLCQETQTLIHPRSKKKKKTQPKRSFPRIKTPFLFEKQPETLTHSKTQKTQTLTSLPFRFLPKLTPFTMTRPKTTLTVPPPGTRAKTRATKKQKTTATSSSSRTIMPERGIDLNNSEVWLAEDVHALGWELFVDPPPQASSELVSEFLKAAAEGELAGLLVKGVVVKFTREEINDSLSTTPVPELEDEFLSYCKGRSDKGIADEIRREICYEGAVWLPGEALERRSLKLEAKVWMHFINSRLIPASHDSRVNWERAVLVFCIMKRKKFDVGRIIRDQLAENVNKKSPFYFPCLISELCRRAGVKLDDEDLVETIPMTSPINASTIARIRKNEDTESTGVEEEDEEEEERTEAKKEGGEDSDETLEGATTAKKPPPSARKPTEEKKKKTFEPPLPLVSQTSLGFGADALVKSVQKIESMVGEELQNVKKAAFAQEQELEQYRRGELTARKRKLEETMEEKKELEELKKTVDNMLTGYQAFMKETSEWRKEIKEEMRSRKEKEDLLWRYIKARDEAFDTNWENKFRNQIRIPAFPDILTPEPIEDAPKDGATSTSKR